MFNWEIIRLDVYSMFKVIEEKQIIKVFFNVNFKVLILNNVKQFIAVQVKFGAIFL